MRNTMKAFLVMIFAGAIVSSASATIVIDETFDTDPTARGWIADNPVWHETGGNPGGCYSGTYATTGGGSPWVGMALGGMDVTATYGNELIASIDVKWEGASAGISWEIYGVGNTSRWKYDFNMVPPTTWTNYNPGSIDTTWTDEEAIAAGWFVQAGTESWADTWTSVNYMLFTMNMAPIYGTGTAYVDNFVLDALNVPEPTTVGLLALGGLVGLVRRRRK